MKLTETQRRVLLAHDRGTLDDLEWTPEEVAADDSIRSAGFLALAAGTLTPAGRAALEQEARP